MILGWSLVHVAFDFWWFLPTGVFVIALLDGLWCLLSGRSGLLDFWEEL